MEMVGQVLLIAFLVSSTVLSGMIGRRMKTYHDGLISACAFTMLVRAACRYLDTDPLGPVYATWLPLAAAMLLFAAVVRRYAELDAIRKICKLHDEFGNEGSNDN